MYGQVARGAGQLSEAGFGLLIAEMCNKMGMEPLSDEQQRVALERQLVAGATGAISQVDLGAEVRILSSLDDRLIAALLSGFIRLVRSAWLIEQPEDYCIERRQVLEERERNGETPTPLLGLQEAADLIRSAGRFVGAVT